MELLNTILKSGNGNALGGLARQFGLGEEQTGQALSALVPALGRSMQKNTNSEGGLSKLMGALQKGNHERFLDDERELTNDSTVTEGNAILGHLFGSKETSREVALKASEKSGVDAGTLKKMLPVVAAMTMGSMSKQTRQAGLTAEQSSNPQAQGMFQKLLDRDGDGSVADDLFGFAKKLF